MPLKELHEEIIKGDYLKVEAIIIKEKIDPQKLYKGKTAIQLCFLIQQKNGLTGGNVFAEMLNNLLFPQTDRFLIGSGRAKRGDIMLVNDDGSFNVVGPDVEFDRDNAMFRVIGEDDYRLSAEFRMKYHATENANKM